MDLQPQFHHLVVATTHAYLDHESYLEVILPKAESSQVQKLADELIGIKGVQHGRLMMSSPAIGSSKST